MLENDAKLFRRRGGFQDREFGSTWDGRSELEEIFCASAGAALYRRSMLQAVRLPTGIFDRDFGLYFEDVDLGWRGRLAGWSAVLAPRAVAYHVRHGSAQRRGNRFVELQCRRNRVGTLLKNASASLLVRSLPGTLRDAILLLVRGGPAGACGYLRSIGRALSQRSNVTALSRVSRRDVEHRWLRESGGTVTGRRSRIRRNRTFLGNSRSVGGSRRFRSGGVFWGTMTHPRR